MTQSFNKPKLISNPTLWEPPDFNGNIWGRRCVWNYQEPNFGELPQLLPHEEAEIPKTTMPKLELRQEHVSTDTSIEFHQLYPIEESDEDKPNVECNSVASHRSQKAETKVQQTAVDLGKYSSEDEDDDSDSVMSIMIRCRGVVDPNRPPDLIQPKRRYWPTELEQKKLQNYASHFGVLVEKDGGVYTTDEECENFEPVKEKARPPRIKKKPSISPKVQRQAALRFRLFKAIQTAFLKRFSQVTKLAEPDRHRIYSAFDIFHLVPADKFTVRRCIEVVDCLMTAIEEKPGIVFYGAEFCQSQYNVLSNLTRRIFFRAILRVVKATVFRPGPNSKNLKYLYITFLGHLHNLDVCPPKIIRYYVYRLFQTNQFGDERISYFDPDSTIYATRLISMILVNWMRMKPTSSGRFPGRLKELRTWLAHLRKADKSPPYVVADINMLLSNFTQDDGKLKFSTFTRLNNCEMQTSLDDLVLITRNSYGRKLFCCREILALYSLSLYQLFFEDYEHGKKELHLDVEYCAMREILRILYHCDRKFTAANFHQYEEDLLLSMARTAFQLDMPMIYRLCELQLASSPSLCLAVKSFDMSLHGVTSRCLAGLDKSEIHDLLKHVLYGRLRYRNRQRVGRTSELATISEAIRIIRRCGSPRKYVQSDPQAELIFPLDFTTPWLLSDVAIETVGSGGRFLFVNRTIMSIFSSFFRDYPYLKAKKWQGHYRIRTTEKYATVRAALRIIHHVRQKFISHRLPTLLPIMLIHLHRCATVLDFPLIIGMCEEQLNEANREYLSAVLRLLAIHLPAPEDRLEALILVKKMLRCSSFNHA